MSNSLADADDFDERKQIVDAILAKRRQWKFVRYEIDTGEKHPDDKPDKPNTLQVSAHHELILELQRIRVNLSKYKSKIELNPNSRKIGDWVQEMQRLEMLKEQAETELSRLK